jgi:hypothetical protein
VRDERVAIVQAPRSRRGRRWRSPRGSAVRRGSDRRDIPGPAGGAPKGFGWAGSEIEQIHVVGESDASPASAELKPLEST